VCLSDRKDTSLLLNLFFNCKLPVKFYITDPDPRTVTPRDIRLLFGRGCHNSQLVPFFPMIRDISFKPLLKGSSRTEAFEGTKILFEKPFSILSENFNCSNIPSDVQCGPNVITFFY
jgi:hypothetical protein